jgi:glutaredoxin
MKVVILYTMKGCPYCTMIKEELEKSNIDFLERDIHEYEQEYDEYSKLIENEYIPAFLLLTLDNEDNPNNIKLYAPERDFQDIHEGVEMVKGYLK